MSTPTLKELLTTELPPGFVATIFERIKLIYPHSYASVINDPALSDEQAKYVLGYYRRGIAETVFMNAAAEHGLLIDEVQPETGGCTHVRVSTENFSFVMCHVQSPGGFPKHSDNREQASKINLHLSQTELFPLQVEPSSNVLYGVFVHTEQPGNKGQFNSLCVGFPDSNFKDWIEEPIDMQEILDLQKRLFQEEEDLQEQVQKVVPILKSSKEIISGKQ